MGPDDALFSCLSVCVCVFVCVLWFVCVVVCVCVCGCNTLHHHYYNKDEIERLQKELKLVSEECAQRTRDALRQKLEAETSNASLENCKGELDRLRVQLDHAASELRRHAASETDGHVRNESPSQQAVVAARLLEEHARAMDGKFSEVYQLKKDLLVLQSASDAARGEKERSERELAEQRSVSARERSEFERSVRTLQEQLEDRDAVHRAAYTPNPDSRIPNPDSRFPIPIPIPDSLIPNPSPNP
jgi:hypothetical protein